jgi:hypothetical protein
MSPLWPATDRSEFGDSNSIWTVEPRQALPTHTQKATCYLQNGTTPRFAQIVWLWERTSDCTALVLRLELWKLSTMLNAYKQQTEQDS